MTTPVMLTIRQAADKAGVPVHAMRRWVADGTVHSVPSGHRFYVSWASVVRFLEGKTDAEMCNT